MEAGAAVNLVKAIAPLPIPKKVSSGIIAKEPALLIERMANLQMMENQIFRYWKGISVLILPVII